MQHFEDYKKEIERKLVESIIAALEQYHMPAEELSLASSFILEKMPPITGQEDLLAFLRELSSRWKIFTHLLVLESGEIKEKTANVTAMFIVKEANVDSPLTLDQQRAREYALKLKERLEANLENPLSALKQDESQSVLGKTQETDDKTEDDMEGFDKKVAQTEFDELEESPPSDTTLADEGHREWCTQFKKNLDAAIAQGGVAKQAEIARFEKDIAAKVNDKVRLTQDEIAHLNYMILREKFHD